MFGAIHQWIRLDKLCKLMGSFYSNFEFFFELMTKSEKYSNEGQGVNISQISLCYISMDSSWQKSIFVFDLLAKKTKNMQINSEAWIFLKFHCFICQYIHLGKLYNLMENFLQISESFFELTTIIRNNSGVGFMQVRGEGESMFVLNGTSNFFFIFILFVLILRIYCRSFFINFNSAGIKFSNKSVFFESWIRTALSAAMFPWVHSVTSLPVASLSLACSNKVSKLCPYWERIDWRGCLLVLYYVPKLFKGVLISNEKSV